MRKKYLIKSNENLFNRYLKLEASTMKKIYSSNIVQNDMELPSEELNKWYADFALEIEQTKLHFDKIITEMQRLREETKIYLKQQQIINEN